MKISEHCYAVQGLYFIPPWSVNAGFIAGNKTTLIIDTGCNNISAQTIYGYAESVKPDNKIIVINTEKHLDHTGGNSFFKDRGAEIYGHFLLKRNDDDFESLKDFFNSQIENPVRRSANEEKIMFSGSRIVNPDIPVSTDTDLDLGGVTVKIILTPGHTETNLSVFVPADRTVFTGDIIVNRFIPNLEEGQTGDWKDWLSSLERIRQLKPEIAVPGHGEYLKLSSEIEDEIKRIKTVINNAVEKKKAPTLK